MLAGHDQLTTEQVTRFSCYTHTFGYDGAGNPTTWKGAAQTFNAGNQNTASTYDADGNPTSWNGNALSFDAASHLTALGTLLSAGYNAEGQRVWKQNASGKTFFLYDGLAPIAEVDGNANVTAVNTWGVNGLASRRTVATNSSVFYTFDEQGGTAQRLDSSGTVLGSYGFDAYGTRTSTDNSTDPYSGYGAQWGYSLDSETGWQLCGQRYYLPGLGRFLNRDPIGYNGGLNLYTYVGSNPFGGIDPWGTASWWDDVKEALQEGLQPIEFDTIQATTYGGMVLGFLGGGTGGAVGGSVVGPGGTVGGGMAGAMAGAAEGGAIGNLAGIGAVVLGRVIQGTIKHFTNGSDGSGGGTSSSPGQSCPTEEDQAVSDGVKHLDDGTRPSYGRKWGEPFGNREGKLPTSDANGNPITYKEYYLQKAPTDTTRWGPRRMVVGSDSQVYYTNDHYTSFRKIR